MADGSTSHGRSLSRVWERLTGSPSSAASPSARSNNTGPDADSGLGLANPDLDPVTPTRPSRSTPSAGLSLSQRGPGASPPRPGDYQDQDDDPDDASQPLSRFSYALPGSYREQPIPSSSSAAEPVVRRAPSASRSLASSSASTVWPKMKVPRWGSGETKRRATVENGSERMGSGGSGGVGVGGDDFDVLDDGEYSDDSPLDGEEGVVVDDEACFVDECSQVGAPVPSAPLPQEQRSLLKRTYVFAPERTDFLFSLPHEISLYVLLHLDFHSLLQASTVSRQWRSLALDHLIWRDLFHREVRWRVREDPFPSSDLSFSPTPLSPISPPPTAPTRRESRSARTEAGTTGASRISRRFTDMMADLGNLSLSPSSNERRRNSTAISPTSPSTTAAGAWLSSSSTATPRRPASGVVSRRPQTPSPPLSRSTSASLENSTSSLPGPSRRVSSATLPPLGPVPSPSLGITPSAPLFLDWPKLFKDRLLLERNWDKGKAKMLTLKGHTDSVYCLQFDQYKVISGSRDRSIRVWDLATNTCVKTLKGHQGSILCLQYDDRVLISGSSDCRIVVWDLVGDKVTGKGKWDQIMTLVGHNMGVLDLCFDDKWIVSCSKDTTIRVWSRKTGELYRILSGHSGPVNAVQLLNGKVVSASGDSLLKLWDIESGEVERVFTGHQRGLACVQYAPSGKLIATGSNDKTVKIWDAETGKCLQTMEGHTDLVRSLAFDETRRRIVSASYDRTLRLWDLDDGAALLKFKAHTSLVFDVSFSASKIMSCSHDQKIVIQDFGDGLDVSKFL
ncbi:F-box and WD-40 domain protein 1/11, partial [Phenoliferia sp. Uapishka_3]